MLNLSTEVKQATTECKKEFSCLEGNRTDLCKVKYCVDRELHFIKCLNEGYCPYQYLFGKEYVCVCPTRKEIYNKYKV